MNTENDLSAQPTAYLFDAGGLTAAEVEDLRQLGSTHWLYAHVGDPRAEALGPCVTPPRKSTEQLASKLAQDAERAWVVSALHARGSLADLIRHLKFLRYVQTQDGQRYYWRYADTRCLNALWFELTDMQRHQVSGPIHRWLHHDRDGRIVNLPISSACERSKVHPAVTSELRISDHQLAGMLDTVWPDQLLASVMEEQADVAGHMSPAKRHACAQKVCDWLHKTGEDRYPVQQTVLRKVLPTAHASWTEHEWDQAMCLAHQQAYESTF
jgi:hypothetical protein